MSGKFALIIANTEYTDPSLSQLSAPGKDAEDFGRVLKSQDICAFDDVKVLLNQQEPIVRNAIFEFFSRKTKDDLLLLYFSGHGVRDEYGALYLAVKNTRCDSLDITAIGSDFVTRRMDQSRSKRQVLILDCCNSGAFDGAKGAIGGNMGIFDTFMGQEGYGRVVLTATNSIQFAWEGKKIDDILGEKTENSLFTHFLVKGLEGEADLEGDGRITIDELYKYISDQIARLAPLQKPQKKANVEEGDIVLRKMTRRDIKPALLPPDLISATENTITLVREGAIKQLENLLKGKNQGLARSAEETLKHIAVMDDSYSLRLLATQILNSIEQASSEQKAEEEHLAILKSEDERSAREKVEVESSSLTAQKSNSERVKRQLYTLVKTNWKMFLNYLRFTQVNNSKIYILIGLGLAVLLVSVAILISQKSYQTTLLFSGLSEGRTDIYYYDGKTPIKITHATQGVKNWSPVFHPLGQLYFTSNRDGSAEIYRMKSDGNAEQVTDGKDNDASWSPAFDLTGQLYFTSNRDGFAEIYRMKSDGNAEQVTDGKGNDASWSPAFDLTGQLYFTSNRDGSAEIYRMKSDGNAEQVTDGKGNDANWSPAFDLTGQLYFTSNRDGSAEIYRMKSDGSAEQVTSTSGTLGSWAPVIKGNTIYFTSDRYGHEEVFLLVGTQAVAISSIESWTAPLTARYPFPNQ